MQSDSLLKAAVSVAQARELLGGIANPTIYELINSGELRTFRVGRRRLVSLEAIHDYIRISECGGQAN